MKIFIRFWACALIVLAVAGCRSAAVRDGFVSDGSRKETMSAVGEVADALTGQSLTDEQRKKLTKDIKTDKQVQSALQSIAGAMDVKTTGVKYCPVDGKRYSSNQNLCPEHQVPLENLVD